MSLRWLRHKAGPISRRQVRADVLQWTDWTMALTMFLPKRTIQAQRIRKKLRHVRETKYVRLTNAERPGALLKETALKDSPQLVVCALALIAKN